MAEEMTLSQKITVVFLVVPVAFFLWLKDKVKP